MQLIVRLAAAAAASLVVAGCEAPGGLEPLPFEPAGPDAAPDPAAFGPYPVGVRTITYVDESRATAGYDGPRTLTTEIWYPAVESARVADTSDPRGVDYSLGDNLPAEALGDVDPSALGVLETIAVRDADPRTDHGRFPVIFFSHGRGGVRMQSTFYTVALASHGYVVVAPDHQGDTLLDLLVEDEPSPAQAYLDRPQDIIFLMNQLDAIGADDPLATVIDMDRLGMTGHSFGALTTMIVAGEGVGVDVAVAQTPVGIGLVQAATSTPVRDLGIPVMLQSSGIDQILPAEQHTQSLWDELQPPRAWLHLAHGGHYTYSDLCIFDAVAIAALGIGDALEDGCGPQNVSTDVAFPLIDNAAIGFFNLHLANSPGSARFVTQDVTTALGGDEATLLVE